MIPFGAVWHPDAAQINAQLVIEARNCIPAVRSFQPLLSPTPITAALPSTCRGAISILRDDGTNVTFAGTQTDLYKYTAASNTWTSVTRASGGSYSVGTGDQWKFALFGNNLIASNINAPLQIIDITSGTNFAAISTGDSSNPAPQARYVDVVREFVLVGDLFGNEKRVQWSGDGLSNAWTPSLNESDYQDLPNGGPVRGIIGGDVAYVFQALQVTRMTYVPGSSYVFQFDTVENAAGLAAPHSLVRLRDQAYYYAADGIRRFDLNSATSTPIGVGKWQNWLLADIKPGTELAVMAMANPVKPQIVFAYISKTSNQPATPTRLLIYDWSLDEATFADLTVECLMRWLSPGETLDQLDAFGTLDTLPFSLDSPFWHGGASLVGVFQTDHTVSVLSGQPMQAYFTTADGQAKQRVQITATKPAIDASGVLVAVSGRERVADPVMFNEPEAMEETGEVPAWVSGNIIRAQVTVPSQTWTQIEGMATNAVPAGSR